MTFGMASGWWALRSRYAIAPETMWPALFQAFAVEPIPNVTTRTRTWAYLCTGRTSCDFGWPRHGLYKEYQGQLKSAKRKKRETFGFTSASLWPTFDGLATAVGPIASRPSWDLSHIERRMTPLPASGHRAAKGVEAIRRRGRLAHVAHGDPRRHPGD